jgi:hypothetical protein
MVALAISQTAYLAAMATLGVRLLLLARRTRQAPEALLAAHFLLCCTLGYALQGTGHALALAPGVSAKIVAPTVAAGHAASLIGVASVLVFNYVVFRRGTRVGRALLAAAVAWLVAGFAGWVATGGFAGRPEGFWFWLLYGGYTIASLWTLYEPLRFFVAMRRRLRLGLADPLVVDRLLFWGLGSLARFAMLAVGAFSMLRLTGDASELATIAAPTFLASGAAGLGVAAAYWIAFFPPRAYLAAVARRG